MSIKHAALIEEISNMNFRTTLYNLALILSLSIFQIVKPIISSRLSNEMYSSGAMVLLTLLLFNFFFFVFEFFDKNYFWVWRSKNPNLTGNWNVTLTSGDDEWYSNITIKQNRDETCVSGYNYSDNKDKPHSEWNSEFAIFEKNHLSYRYLVEATDDTYIAREVNPIKTGLSRIRFNTNKKLDSYTGSFTDSYPDTSMGRMAFSRVKE